MPPTRGLYSFAMEMVRDDASTGRMRCALYLDPSPEGAADEAATGTQRQDCLRGPVLLEGGQRYRFAFAAIIGGGEQLALRATVELPSATSDMLSSAVASSRAAGGSPDANLSNLSLHTFRFAATPAEWFEEGVPASAESSPAAPTSAEAPSSPAVVSVHVHGLRAYCRAPTGCTYDAAAARAARTASFSSPERRSTPHKAPPSATMHGATWVKPPLPPPPPPPPPPHLVVAAAGLRLEAGDANALPLLPLLRANVGDRQRRLQTTCGEGSCCVVLFRGERGAQCTAVPVWDFSTWVHPGGGFVTRDSHRLCNSVRYSWLTRSGNHVLQPDPEDITLTSLGGGATRIGEFIDPHCAVASNKTYTVIQVLLPPSSPGTRLPHGLACPCLVAA